MGDFTVKVDNGKYTFIQRGGWKLDVLRHGEPWVEDLGCSKAIHSMMAELDSARVVLVAARRLADFFENMPLELAAALAAHDATVGLVRALSLHDALVDDHEPPSEWSDSTGAYRDTVPR